MVVVSGAASGPGLASAVRFGAGGYDVGLIDVDRVRGEQAAQRVRALGREAVFCGRKHPHRGGVEQVLAARAQALQSVLVVGARTRQWTTRSPSMHSRSRRTNRHTNPLAPVRTTSRTSVTGTASASLPSPMARRTNARRLSRSR